MDNKLNILYLNCLGAVNKENELKNLVQQLKTHIILLNKIHLIPETKIKLPNYYVYRNDCVYANRNHSTGRTAILISNRFIRHKDVILTASIDNTTIHIMINNSEIWLSAVSNSLKTTLQLADIDELLDFFLSPILTGDLNSCILSDAATQ